MVCGYFFVKDSIKSETCSLKANIKHNNSGEIAGLTIHGLKMPILSEKLGFGIFLINAKTDQRQLEFRL
jgi:hypothetical protein